MPSKNRTMTTRDSSSERVVVVLDEDTEGALEIAADLAARHRLQLVGMFIQDHDLLTSAGLPFAREIGLVSGIARPLTAADVAHAMRERAERLRARIHRVARERGLEAEFEEGRGWHEVTVLGRVRPQDLLVLGRGDWIRPAARVIERVLVQASCTVMLVGAVSRLQEPPHGPMVLIDGSASSMHALSRAISLARDGSEIVTLVTVPGKVNEAARERVRRLLQEQRIEGRFAELPGGSLGELVRLIRRERPRMLLIGRDSALVPDMRERWWLELGDLPVALVP